MVSDKWFNESKFSLPPAEFCSLRSAANRALLLSGHVRQFLARRPSVDDPKDKAILQHLLRKALACPLNVMLTATENIIEGIVSSLHAFDAQQPPAEAPAPKAPAPSTETIIDGRKRKRGKRAKLTFLEEKGLSVDPGEKGIYCLCHQPETGVMCACDRCQLWFHNSCVGLSEEPDLGEEKWICPICCCKTDRKYPHADVKVRPPGESLRSAQLLVFVLIANMSTDGEEDSIVFLDIRQTLRSESVPVTRPQMWAENQPQVLLHLDTFFPAVRIQEPDQERPSKRARNEHAEALSGRSSKQDDMQVEAEVNGSSEQQAGPESPSAEAKVSDTAAERHKLGMANLYARGVTDEMINKWYIGWNGRTLIYPRYTTDGRVQHIELGSEVTLLPHDRDGSIFMSTVLARQAERSLFQIQDLLQSEKQWQMSHAPATISFDGDESARPRSEGVHTGALEGIQVQQHPPQLDTEVGQGKAESSTTALEKTTGIGESDSAQAPLGKSISPPSASLHSGSPSANPADADHWSHHADRSRASNGQTQQRDRDDSRLSARQQAESSALAHQTDARLVGRQERDGRPPGLPSFRRKSDEEDELRDRVKTESPPQPEAPAQASHQSNSQGSQHRSAETVTVTAPEVRSKATMNRAKARKQAMEANPGADEAEIEAIVRAMMRVHKTAPPPSEALPQEKTETAREKARREAMEANPGADEAEIEAIIRATLRGAKLF